MDAATFRLVSHAVARTAGARLLAVHEPAITPNFYATAMRFEGRMIHLLCSMDGAWAFSATDPSRSCSLEFVDSPALSSVLRDLFDVEAMTASELFVPFSPQSGMSATDIRYWKPKSLGEALFNWWD